MRDDQKVEFTKPIANHLLLAIGTTVAISGVLSACGTPEWMEKGYLIVATVGVVSTGILLATQQAFNQRLHGMQEFFKQHSDKFLSDHNSIEDPIAFNAFKTDVGSFIRYHNRLKVIKKESVNKTQKIHLGLASAFILSLLTFLVDPLTIFVGNSWLNKTPFILDLKVLTLYFCVMVLYVTSFTINQFLAIRSWGNNLLELYLENKEAEQGSRLNIQQKRQAVIDINKYFTGDQNIDVKNRLAEFIKKGI